MAEGASILSELETQKNEISRILQRALVKGDAWCVIDNKWLKQWKKYVGYDSWETANVGDRATHPGPIDNSPLLRDDGSNEIKEHLIDELDYAVLPEEAWDLLVKWYSLTESQRPIVRKVIEYGMFVKHRKVEVYPLEFKVCSNSDLEHTFSRKYSKADTIEYIEQELRRLFNIPAEKEVRLWNRYSSNTYEHLSKKESTVQDAGLYHGQVIIIEQMNDDGTWPRQVKSTSAALAYANSTSTGSGDTRMYANQTNTIATRSYGSVGYSDASFSYHTSGNVDPGQCGLSNLGNTCFMNSALQCMMNTPPLVEYFLQDQYWDELNKDNLLGMQGEIAKSFGELVKNMWCGRFTYIMPRNFKMIVGRFAPQFSGYQQQDCQELMAFLLDGLHEDLNRVKKKPYIELKDANGRPDDVVAKEAWDNYVKRNNSVIVDVFHGLLKSTLVCPECSKVSVTFDPFCYLSLPLPIKKERQMELMLVSCDPLKKPLKMKVTVPKMAVIRDLCDAISRITHHPATNYVIAEIYNHRLHKIYKKEENLGIILERDEIFAYELPLGIEDGCTFMLPVYLKEKKIKASSNYSDGSSQLFGFPFFAPVPARNCTYEMLYNILLQYMARFTKCPETEEDWELVESWGKQNGEVPVSNGDDYDSEPSDGEREPMEDATDCSRHLFAIRGVNAYGNVDVDHYTNDGLPLKIDRKIYLVVEWQEKVKERFVDVKEAVSFESHDSMGLRAPGKKQVIQLSQCLELFTTVEKLGAEDPWYCPACKKHQQATKKFDLWSLPQVLIIHLKRFTYSRYWRDKLDALVHFPVSALNMGKYLLDPAHPPALYDLIAVANHFGGMGGGHYTAYGKNKNSGQWYYFDDSNVASSSEDSVVSKAAYVLFYQRRDSQNTPSSRQPICAALGAPRNVSSPDSSSDEDCSMDVN